MTFVMLCRASEPTWPSISSLVRSSSNTRLL
jgi:hypothetical protein